MAYNNRNILLKMIEIQNLVLERKKLGITQRHVFLTEIEPRYYISYSTFNRYLAYPAKRELSKLMNPQVKCKSQIYRRHNKK